MAKGLIEIALQLGKNLGANTSKFMGTKSNVTFLGSGPKDGMLFQKDINPESFASIGIEKVLPDIETSLGYAVGGKLNDIQLNKLIRNLKTMDETINPLPVTNITDLATGTRNLDQEGLASLRLMSDDFGNIAPEEAAKLKELKNIDVPSNLNSLRAKSGMVERPINRSGELTSIADEPGQAGLSYAIKNPAKIPTDETADVPFPEVENLPRGVGLRKAPIDELENYTKSEGDIIKDLVDRKFGVGYFDNVDEAATGIMATVEKGDLPAKTGAAREFLVNSLKVGDEASSTTLSDVMSAQDMKYIFEGGGGAMGDPLVLVQKYFGPRIAEMIPNGGTTEEIAIFTKRVMNNVEDAKGFRPDEPEFDPLTAMFVDNLADGGRAGYAQGGLAKILEL